MISACILAFVYLVFCVSLFCEWSKRLKKTIYAKVNVTGAFFQCMYTLSYIYIRCISAKQSEWYAFYNIPFPNAVVTGFPLKHIFISAICNIHKDKKKNTPNNHFFCIPVVLEACTVVTFVHGVTDHELSGVSQLSWSFYLTVSMTIFTTLFLFILLHTTLYCKYLSCLSVVLCLHIFTLPFYSFFQHYLNQWK